MSKFMNKFVELAKNDHIQGAMVSGLCIIILALVFKKILHVEVSNFESAAPGIMFTFYEITKAKTTKWPWNKVWLWNILMLVATGLIILRHIL